MGILGRDGGAVTIARAAFSPCPIGLDLPISFGSIAGSIQGLAGGGKG